MSQKIVIVEDDPNIKYLIEQTLEELVEEEGVELFTADNGEDALSIIQKENPELVFLDVMMPRKDGFEVCNIVKNELAMETYIIMLTAKGQQFDHEKGKQVGANLYMTKPFDPEELLEKAYEILGIDEHSE